MAQRLDTHPAGAARCGGGGAVRCKRRVATSPVGRRPASAAAGLAPWSPGHSRRIT